MDADGVFRLAIAASLCVHAGLLVQYHGRSRPVPQRPVDTSVEITYFDIADEPLVAQSPPVAAVIQPATPTPVETSTAAPGSHARDFSDPSSEPAEPAAPSDEMPAGEPVPVDLNQPLETLTDDPAYLDYFRAIRARIRRYALYSRPQRWIEGEVQLQFTLNADGHVMQIQVVDPGSSEHHVIRQASIRSIQQASPFPPFPATIERKTIPFNIVISFEINR